MGRGGLQCKRARREPPEDDGNRGIENAVLLGFFVVPFSSAIT